MDRMRGPSVSTELEWSYNATCLLSALVPPDSAWARRCNSIHTWTSALNRDTDVTLTEPSGRTTPPPLPPPQHTHTHAPAPISQRPLASVMRVRRASACRPSSVQDPGPGFVLCAESGWVSKPPLTDEQRMGGGLKRLPWVGGPGPAKKAPSVGFVYFCVPHDTERLAERTKQPVSAIVPALFLAIIISSFLPPTLYIT